MKTSPQYSDLPSYDDFEEGNGRAVSGSYSNDKFQQDYHLQYDMKNFQGSSSPYHPEPSYVGPGLYHGYVAGQSPLDPNPESEDVHLQILTKRRHRSYFLILCTMVQLGMLIYSMVYNLQHFGELIETDPFNFMIGPSAPTLVALGAKYTPCIIPTNYFNPPECPDEYRDSYPPVNIQLLNGTIIACGDLEAFCAMGGFKEPDVPDQWWRYITPIFLHGGVIHLLANMLFQVRAGFEIEREIGAIRMFFIYMLSGVFGFIVSANFSTKIPAVGCSGSLFGLFAVMIVDLVLHWKLVPSPGCELIKLNSLALFSLLLGTLPFFDNFAHLGGFVMGLFASFVFLPKVYFGKWDICRKWTLLVISFVIVAGLMGACLYRIYFLGVDDSCVWCNYLNCLPIKAFEAWCLD